MGKAKLQGGGGSSLNSDASVEYEYFATDTDVPKGTFIDWTAPDDFVVTSEVGTSFTNGSSSSSLNKRCIPIGENRFIALLINSSTSYALAYLINGQELTITSSLMLHSVSGGVYADAVKISDDTIAIVGGQSYLVYCWILKLDTNTGTIITVSKTKIATNISINNVLTTFDSSTRELLWMSNGMYGVIYVGTDLSVQILKSASSHSMNTSYKYGVLVLMPNGTYIVCSAKGSLGKCYLYLEPFSLVNHEIHLGTPVVYNSSSRTIYFNFLPVTLSDDYCAVGFTEYTGTSYPSFVKMCLLNVSNCNVTVEFTNSEHSTGSSSVLESYMAYSKKNKTLTCAYSNKKILRYAYDEKRHALILISCFDYSCNNAMFLYTLADSDEHNFIACLYENTNLSYTFRIFVLDETRLNGTVNVPKVRSDNILSNRGVVTSKCTSTKKGKVLLPANNYL